LKQRDAAVVGERRIAVPGFAGQGKAAGNASNVAASLTTREAE